MGSRYPVPNRTMDYQKNWDTTQTMYDRIDQFDVSVERDVIQVMDDLPFSILATRGPWTIVTALVYDELYNETWETKKKFEEEIIFPNFPTTTRKTIRETLKSIEAGEELKDRSEYGKDKKNTAQENFMFIATLKALSPYDHIPEEEQEELGVFA